MFQTPEYKDIGFRELRPGHMLTQQCFDGQHVTFAMRYTGIDIFNECLLVFNALQQLI